MLTAEQYARIQQAVKLVYLWWNENRHRYSQYYRSKEESSNENDR